MGRLQNKIALITGATGGIGQATAKAFLREGARVMLVGRSAEKLAVVKNKLGEGTSTYVAEASDEKATAGAVEETVRAFGGLDIAFANAGNEGLMAPVDQIERTQFQQVLETNVIGAWLTIKHSVPALRNRGGGSIIVTGSIAGTVGFSGGAPYVASKHAVNGLVKCAASDLAPSNIRVNCIAPGPVDNRMIRSLEEQIAPGNADAVREVFMAKIPMRRYATEEEVANLALFLASDESTYCTGATYTIDGGYVAE